MKKEFHVWFRTHFGMTANGYDHVVKQIKTGIPHISTENVIFADMKIITKYGYRLFIHPANGNLFEITLGECANLDRELRPEMNLLKMLINGAFDTDECTVIEEEI